MLMRIMNLNPISETMIHRNGNQLISRKITAQFCMVSQGNASSYAATTNRSKNSHQMCSVTHFTGKHLRWNLILIKLQAFRPSQSKVFQMQRS